MTTKKNPTRTPTTKKTPNTANPPPPASPPPEPPPVITNAGADASNAKDSTELAYQTLMSGLQANFEPTFVFTLDGEQKATTDLLGVFATRIAAAEATKTAKNGYHLAVDQERASDAEAKPLRAGLRTYFQAQLGKTSPKLRIYGFEPRKIPVVTAEVKAAAQAKGRATREKKKSGGTTPPPAPPAAK